MSEGSTCSSGKFWHRAEPEHTYADCRRQPPQFSLAVNIRRDRFGDKQDEITVSRFPNAQWPNTAHDDWCGEYAVDRRLIEPVGGIF
ncbi:hypothetical protein [Beijerinckia sp. L45]|uniref:hypothetical protein n=1 Tax=Beijerinckia sp. L45 TaxID=1641855 RepID=UPI00131E2AD4|nr:hypothetical protein [Beijerinckia sp. L45]